MLSNADLAELLALASEAEPRGTNKHNALARSAGAALFWSEEAAAIRDADRPLTELASVGPYVAGRISAWLADPPEVPAPPPTRAGFMTMASAHAVVDAHPEWRRLLRCDLQMHTTDSDGSLPLPEMVEAARRRGYGHIAITDHTKGLPIANGMNEERLAGQAVRIAELNRRLAADGSDFAVLHSVEMNLSPEGDGDMDPAALAQLDLVLGAFHSSLRLREDQTERYLSGVRNPTVDVLAHPRTRMFNRRAGLPADWARVFEEAAALGTAVEVDCNPNRQDLDVETLRIAAQTEVLISVGSDAHSADELTTTDMGLATIILAGIPAERVIATWPRERLLEWAGRR